MDDHDLIRKNLQPFPEEEEQVRNFNILFTFLFFIYFATQKKQDKYKTRNRKKESSERLQTKVVKRP